MNKVGIVTDSTFCLPPDLINKYNIRVVPAGVSIDNKAYRDQIDISNDEFWRLFKKAKHFPTTSAIAPGEFINAVSGSVRDTDSIVACWYRKLQALSRVQPNREKN